MTAMNVDIAPGFDADRIRDFEFAVRNGYKRIYGLAFSMLGNAGDAEDATQETFMRAWRHLDQYDRSHPILNWLSTIARNYIRDVVRKQRSRIMLSLDAVRGECLEGLIGLLQTQDSTEDPQSTALAAETEEVCREAIALLPERYQTALALHVFGRHSYGEIARIMHCPLGTVRSRLHRGRELVRRSIEQQDSGNAIAA